jgi:hypothetical protein
MQPGNFPYRDSTALNHYTDNNVPETCGKVIRQTIIRLGTATPAAAHGSIIQPGDVSNAKLMKMTSRA